MIVLDASAAIEWLLGTSKAEAVEARLFTGRSRSRSWHTPHLLDVEVAQVLRRLVRSQAVSQARAAQALDDLADMPLTRYPHDWLLPRIWALRANLTAYDAAYVAVAEALGAPLVTCDRRLTDAPGHRARILIV